MSSHLLGHFETMKVLVTLGFTLLVTSAFVCNDLIASQSSSVTAPNQQAINFFKRQVDAGSSIGNTLKSLLDRYPQRTSEFVSIAFSAYPNRYSEIISASVSAKPMFVDEIIKLANEHKVAKPTEIITLAVNAEPSYAAIATSAACKNNPEYFNEIVRTAVIAEPDSADQIAQKLVVAFPSRTMEILITTIKEVPFVGKYVLDALLATVVDDQAKSHDMIIVSLEQLARYPGTIERLVELAQQHEIDAERVRLSGIKGGLSEKEIVSVINDHYPNLTERLDKP
jgi:hypothetical protein